MITTSIIKQNKLYNNFISRNLHKILSIIFKLRINLQHLEVLIMLKLKLLVISLRSNKVNFMGPLRRVVSVELVD